MSPKEFLTKLYNNLNILQEREAKYGGVAPLELVNQIEDHRQAITLTQKVIAGDIDEAAWLEALQPLLIGSGHWAGIGLVTMLLLSGYAPDSGVSLSQTVGQPAAEQAGELLSLVLARVEKVDTRIARKYPDNPAGYDAPLNDALAELLETNQSLVADLKVQLEQFHHALQQHNRINPGGQTVQGKGAVAIQQGNQGQVIIGSSIGGDVLGPGATKGEGKQ